MSDNTKWMPSDDAIRACSAVDHVESANMKLYVVTATGTLLYRTGLRAQLAKLEEFTPFLQVIASERLFSAALNHVCYHIEKEIDALRQELDERVVDAK